MIPQYSIFCDECGDVVAEADSFDIAAAGKNYTVCSDHCAAAIREKYGSSDEAAEEKE